MKELIEQVDEIKALVQKLDDHQLHFKPNGDRWSVLEIIEHIVYVDTGLSRLLTMNEGEPETQKQYVTTKGFELVATNRKMKVSAPERLRPTGQFKSAEVALEQLMAVRQKITNGLNDGSIDFSVASRPHGVLGPMTKTDWVHFIVYHAKRHILQMEENLEVCKK